MISAIPSPLENINNILNPGFKLDDAILGKIQSLSHSIIQDMQLKMVMCGMDKNKMMQLTVSEGGESVSNVVKVFIERMGLVIAKEIEKFPAINNSLNVTMPNLVNMETIKVELNKGNMAAMTMFSGPENAYKKKVIYAQSLPALKQFVATEGEENIGKIVSG